MASGPPGPPICRLNLADGAELAAVFAEWAERFPGMRGVYVQEQIAGGPELILGGSYDPALGHAVLVGMGGTLVELLKDVALGHVPLTGADAAAMLEQLACRPLLDGYRGSAPVDLDKLKDAMLRLSRMLAEIPEIQELDINPILYVPQRGEFVAVDFRVKTRG